MLRYFLSILFISMNIFMILHRRLSKPTELRVQRPTLTCDHHESSSLKQATPPLTWPQPQCRAWPAITISSREGGQSRDQTLHDIHLMSIIYQNCSLLWIMLIALGHFAEGVTSFDIQVYDMTCLYRVTLIEYHILQRKVCICIDMYLCIHSYSRMPECVCSSIPSSIYFTIYLSVCVSSYPFVCPSVYR